MVLIAQVRISTHTCENEFVEYMRLIQDRFILHLFNDSDGPCVVDVLEFRESEQVSDISLYYKVSTLFQ